MTPIRVLLAHSSSPDFSGMGEPWAAVDHALEQVGAEVTQRLLLDNSPKPNPPDLPAGWEYRSTPESTSEFEAWSSALHDGNTSARTLLVTGAIATRGVRGSLGDALNDPRASGHVVERFAPHRLDGVWVRAFVGTSTLVLPEQWSDTAPLSRWSLSDLDPTFDPRAPFGPATVVPQSVLRHAWWWLTWRWSEYTRAGAPDPQRMDFLYRKTLSLCNEIALSPRLLTTPDHTSPSHRAKRNPAQSFGPVTAGQLLANPREIAVFNTLGPDTVCRAALTYRSSRRLTRVTIDRVLSARASR